MIVLMASGNAAIISANPADSVRTLSATIAAELAEVVFGGPHYTVLFALAVLLFIVTFAINSIGDQFITRMKRRMGVAPQPAGGINGSFTGWGFVPLFRSFSQFCTEARISPSV